VADRPQADQGKGLRILEQLLTYSTFLFIFYVLTDIRKGGDLRHIIPFVTAALSIGYMIAKKEAAVLASPLFYAVAGYTVVSYLLLPFSFDAAVSFHELNKGILSGLVLFVAVALLAKTERGMDRILGFLVIMLAFISLSGYFTLLKRYINRGVTGHVFPNISALKFSMHHNGFAMVLNMLIPFVSAGMVRMRERRHAYLAWSALALGAAAVILSLSRGGWVSLFITFVFFTIFFRRKIRVSRMTMAAGSALFAVLAVIVLIVPTVRERIQGTSRDISTLNQRVGVWQHHMKAIGQAPFSGWGYGDRIIWDGAPLLLDRDNVANVPEHIRIGSHNTVLHVLFHQGVFGLIAYAAILITAFAMVIRINPFRKHRVMAVAVLTVLTGSFVVHAVVEIVQFRLICLVLGILAGLHETVMTQSHEDPERIA
jgi:O-antigen ligase